MCDCRCYVVPPHLLRSISESTHNPQPVRDAAREALTYQAKVSTCRHDRSQAFVKGRMDKVKNRVLRSRVQKPKVQSTPSIAPVDLLRQISESENVDYRVREHARRDLEHTTNLHKRVLGAQKRNGMMSSHPELPDRLDVARALTVVVQRSTLRRLPTTKTLRREGRTRSSTEQCTMLKTPTLSSLSRDP